MIEIQFNMKNSILLAFLATDFCSGLQLFRLDNTFLLAFIAPSNFLTETISMRVTHITGPAHNVFFTTTTKDLVELMFSDKAISNYC